MGDRGRDVRWALSRACSHPPFAAPRLTGAQWFYTYNELSAQLPQPHNLLQKLGRQALIGFCASVVSDTASNSLRVVKTYRQVRSAFPIPVAAFME